MDSHDEVSFIFSLCVFEPRSVVEVSKNSASDGGADLKTFAPFRKGGALVVQRFVLEKERNAADGHLPSLNSQRRISGRELPSSSLHSSGLLSPLVQKDATTISSNSPFEEEHDFLFPCGAGASSYLHQGSFE